VLKMSETMDLLDIDKVDPPGDAVRDLIDPEKVRELAESIRSQGLLQPIVVRPVNGRYEVVAGHRRYLAHRLIGEVKIKSIVKEMNDEEVFLIRAMENDQREDLNPIEKAKVYKRLQEKFGWSIAHIASKMGRNRATIGRFIELLELPDDVQKAVAKGELSIAAAACLNKIDDKDFRDYYLRAAIENGVTLEVAQMWVNDYQKTKAGLGEDGTGGRGDLGPIPDPLPVFQTCICCVGPVETNKIKYIPVCPECEKQIRGALKPK
jgi:ParB family chromosome partitioning protein